MRSLVAVAAVALGCGEATSVVAVGVADATAGSEAGVVIGGVPVAPAVAGSCADLAAAYCQKLAACLPHDADIDYADPAVCKARETLRCASWLSAPDASPSTASIAACMAQIAADDCNGIGYGGPPRCFFAAGSRPVGHPCSVDSQCAGKFCQASGSACGVCASEAVIGQACGPKQCAAGLACVYDPAQKGYRCRARAQLGQPCNDNVKYETACAYGLVCSGGLCAKAGQLGQSCQQVACDHAKGLDCDKTSRTCVAIPMAAAGQACTVSGMGANTYVECRDGLCVNQNDMGSGHCAAYAPDGAACDGWNGPPCRTPAVCKGGLCQMPPLMCP